MAEGADDRITPQQACDQWGPEFGLVWPIAAVARAVGVPEPTLRTWDRRYGIGPSERTEGGHRRYTCTDIDCLTIMTHFIALGLKPEQAAERTHAVGESEFHRVARELA